MFLSQTIWIAFTSTPSLLVHPKQNKSTFNSLFIKNNSAKERIFLFLSVHLISRNNKFITKQESLEKKSHKFNPIKIAKEYLNVLFHQIFLPLQMLTINLTCSNLELTIIFPTYTYKLYLLLCNPLPQVALRPLQGEHYCKNKIKYKSSLWKQWCEMM